MKTWLVPLARLGVTIIVAVLQAVFANTAFAAGLPKDPCALVTSTDIQALAASGQIGSGKPDSAMAPLGVGCKYSWGPRSSQWGDSEVTITILDTSQAYAGSDAATLKLGFAAKVKADNANKALGNQAWLLAGIGDAADFTYEARSHNGTAESYLSAKGVIVALTFHGDSLANKDKVIALLKTAVSRL